MTAIDVLFILKRIQDLEREGGGGGGGEEEGGRELERGVRKGFVYCCPQPPFH